MVPKEDLNVRLVEEHILISSQTKYDMIGYVQLSLEVFYKYTLITRFSLCVFLRIRFHLYNYFTLFFNVCLTLSK